MTSPSLLILPGDGIGPEVMAEVRKVIDWYGAKRDLTFDVSEDLVGGLAHRLGLPRVVGGMWLVHGAVTPA